MPLLKIKWKKGSGFLLALSVGLFIFLGMMIGNQLRYSNVSLLINQTHTIAEKITGHGHQLADYINQTKIEITPNLIKQFDLNLKEESFSQIQKEVKRIPPNRIKATEKMNKSILLLRKAKVNYDLALNELKVKNYKAAKEQLNFALYYAEKAQTVVKEKPVLSFNKRVFK